MEENLVIVESPAKAKTIKKFLGDDFLVTSSFGHVRDLAKKDLGVSIEQNFAPTYEVSEDKKKIVAELRKLVKNVKHVWLASDEDREGEAIAWHLAELLKLDMDKTQRIVFHEITKDAIVKAIKAPRKINHDLVNAQQARRILDRLVGFEISPVLWKKVKPSLSAGRVQSVSVKLLVEREREIINFSSTPYYKVSAIFDVPDGRGNIVKMKAELPKRLSAKEEVLALLNECKGAEFKVDKVETKPSKKSPAPPFTTSTLQQEASRKLSFSVAQTMAVAQRLYEAGKITYMRTDSLNLSDLAINTAISEIKTEFGEEYLHVRRHKTKAKGAQEAHEAIRPTYMNKRTVSGSDQEQKLYELIWKRTIASQMSDARLEKTTATINISTTTEQFVATGEVLKFDGFLKVYIESTDDEKEPKNYTVENLLPPLAKNDILNLEHILARQRFTGHPPRYTEASLVKKLEELGIGRPSTYAPTISTIQQRGYVVKDFKDGEERQYDVITLQNDVVKEELKTEITGAEKNKLFPTDIGMVVTDFLCEHFHRVMDYNFTASVEKQFDEIAEGQLVWQDMLKEFYEPFHGRVTKTLENSERNTGQRHIGDDPETGKPVYARIGRYGPMVQLGDSNTEDPEAEKPKFAGLLKGQHIETLTIEEALELFKLPRELGKYENKVVVAAIGRFGPYIRHDSKFVSLKKGIDDPYSVQLERAIFLIEEKREADSKKLIKTFKEDEGLQILNGRWGAYISHNKDNYKIPKEQKDKAAELTYQECKKIMEAGPASKKGKAAASKKADAKATTTSKTTAKKTTTKTTARKKPAAKGK